MVKNIFGDPQVGTYISLVKKAAFGQMPLSRPVYNDRTWGNNYYLTESGNKAYATPTSGGLFLEQQKEIEALRQAVAK